MGISTKSTGLTDVGPITSRDHPMIQPAVIRAAVAQLAQDRKALALYKAQLGEMRLTFERDHEPMITRIERLTAAVADGEANVRALAVDRFHVTDDRHPAPGLEIKLFTTVEIDEAQAFAFAKEKGVALKLDLAVIDAMLKADPQSVPGGRVFELPKCVVARDLEKALAVADATKAGA